MGIVASAGINVDGFSVGLSAGASLGVSSGFAQWKLSYGISPIIFTGGIAANMPGGQMPIISITDAGSFPGGPLGAIGASIGASVDLGPISISGQIGVFAGTGAGSGLDDYFAAYEPIAGGTLEDFEYGRYPFANQSVAANAAIQEPLTISMLMVCPVKGTQTFGQHLSIIMALQSAMQQHAALGGSYTVATPKYIYTNCLLRRMVDVTTGDSHQPQSRFQLDFEQPLITLQQAQQAQNGLMSKLSSGTQLPGVPSVGDAMSSLAQSLPSGLSVQSALPLLNSGVSSFMASSVLSAVLPGSGTVAGALSALSDVIPAALTANTALLLLSGVLPTGMSPTDAAGFLDVLTPSGITATAANALLAGTLPGGTSPADIFDQVTGVLPTGVSLTAGLSLLSGVNVPAVGISLSGGVSVLGQPLSLATPPTIPAASGLPGAGAVSASAGAYVSLGGVSVGASVSL